jgi:hypothetical protein
MSTGFKPLIELENWAEREVQDGPEKQPRRPGRQQAVLDTDAAALEADRERAFHAIVAFDSSSSSSSLARASFRFPRL